MKQLKQRRYELGQVGARLWGRERARPVRAEIETILTDSGEGTVVIVDLGGVEVMDYSFSAELLGKILGRMDTEYPGRALVVSGVNEAVQGNLGPALESLNLLVLELTNGGGWKLLGRQAQSDRETLEAVEGLGEATAPQVADRLSKQLTTTNQRLRKLCSMGAVLRRRVSAPSGGDQYRYAWPI